MNIVDLFLIFFFATAIYTGYARGMVKEVYDILALIITVIIAFLLRNPVSDFIIDHINFKTLFHLDITDKMYELILSFVQPVLGFTVVFTIVWLIIKITLIILMKTNKIPKRIDNYNWIGSVISTFKALFFYSVLAFVFSFAFLTPYSTLYDDSLFLEPLLKTNIPLYNMRTNAVKIYDDAQTINRLMQNNGVLTNTKEVVAALKSIKENPLISEDLIVNIARATVTNDKEIVMTNFNAAEFKVNLQQDPNYILFKSLYDEKVINDELVIRLLETYNVKGITKTDIQTIFN